MRKYLKKANLIPLAQACWYGVCVRDFGSSWTDPLERARFILVGAATLSGLVAVIVLIMGGFTFITSAGDPEKVEKGSKMVTNAVIGLVIILLSSVLIRFVIDMVLGA